MLSKFLRKNGLISALLKAVESKTNIRIPLGNTTRWQVAIPTEIDFWERYFKTKGLQWKQDYSRRLDPNTEVEDDIKNVLPNRSTLNVLDVGAGPLTVLGKVCNGKRLNIVAVDPLAKYYDDLMEKYGVKPVVRTEKLEAETLTNRFEKNSFDLVFAQNCIDHSFSPETSILQMLAVVKPGCYVYMRHSQNEAIKEKWQGLHQWNFSSDQGDFIISSRKSSLNFSRKHSDLCATECVVDNSNDWILVKLKKY